MTKEIFFLSTQEDSGRSYSFIPRSFPLEYHSDSQVKNVKYELWMVAYGVPCHYMHKKLNWKQTRRVRDRQGHIMDHEFFSSVLKWK